MRVVSVNRGESRPLPGKDESSGIYKLPVPELQVGVLGAAGDVVVDTRHHGGPSKALCCYNAEHLDHWRGIYPEADWSPGAFGENLTVAGLDEDNAAIGDIHRIGEVTVQISQPRGPCYKLAAKLGIPEFVKVCVASTYTGWYVRVLTPGTVRSGDPIERLAKHPAGMTVAETNRIRYAAEPDVGALDRLLAVDALSDAWRSDLAEQRKRAMRLP